MKYLRSDPVESAAEPVKSGEFRCELAAWTVLKLGLAELAELRKQPGTRFPANITPQFLKNSDDQTLASLAGVYAAMSSLESAPVDYRDWSVVSGSRYIGRSAFAATLHRYDKDGPWGVSVQVIPQNLLHSVSSSISLALQCHGACLGVGGGHNGEIDALLTAANLLTDQACPGVWVTWSCWDPELQIEASGRPVSESSCIVAALALRPIGQLPTRNQLAIRPSEVSLNQLATAGGTRSIDLAGLLLDLSRLRPKVFDVVCPLSGDLELEISCRATAVSADVPSPWFLRQQSMATIAVPVE